MTDPLPDEQRWIGVQRAFECYCSCSETITYCLEQGGAYVTKPLLQLLIDCAEICKTTSGFLLRGSTLQQKVAVVCAEACEECAQRCEQIDDDRLRQCAEVCGRSADACRNLAGPSTGPVSPPRWQPGLVGRLT
jgi:hypothetical protein